VSPSEAERTSYNTGNGPERKGGAEGDGYSLTLREVAPMETKSYVILVVIYLLCGCILYSYGNKLLARIMKKALAKRIALSVSLVLILSVLFLITWAYVYV